MIFLWMVNWSQIIYRLFLVAILCSISYIEFLCSVCPKFLWATAMLENGKKVVFCIKIVILFWSVYVTWERNRHFSHAQFARLRRRLFSTCFLARPNQARSNSNSHFPASPPSDRRFWTDSYEKSLKILLLKFVLIRSLCLWAKKIGFS